MNLSVIIGDLSTEIHKRYRPIRRNFPQKITSIPLKMTNYATKNYLTACAVFSFQGVIINNDKTILNKYKFVINIQSKHKVPQKNPSSYLSNNAKTQRNATTR